MKIKFITLISVFVLAFCTLTASAQNKCGDNAYWEIAGSTLKISGSGAMYDYSKKSPAPWAKQSEKITSLEISPKITKTGSWSFANLTELADIHFGGGLSEIGARSFYNCSSVERLTLPEGLTKVGEGAFNSCTSVKRIDLPQTLTEIGSSAFMNIPKITSVVLPKSVNTIGSWAFLGNTGMRNLYFEGNPPENVGTGILSEIDEDFVIYCHYSTASVWAKSDLFPLDNMYIYDPDALIPVYVNDIEVIFDQHPVIVNDRTLVPVRAIFEAMGIKVNWNSKTNTVTAEKNGTEIRLIIGENIMYKNGSPVTLDCPAQIVNDRTLVPVRAISEAFEADVQWDDTARCVEIFIEK